MGDTWLAFAFPRILDVKTVVSESPIPPFKDGAKFEALRVLTGRDRFRLDYILEGWQNPDSTQRTAPLSVLTKVEGMVVLGRAMVSPAVVELLEGAITQLE